MHDLRYVLYTTSRALAVEPNHSLVAKYQVEENIALDVLTVLERLSFFVLSSLRAQRKAAGALSSSTSQNHATLFSNEAVGVAVKAALTSLTYNGPDVENNLQAAHTRSIMDDLPPSSDPDLSDACSDISDVHFLPEVTSSSDEELETDTEYEGLEGSTSSDDECSKQKVKTQPSDKYKRRLDGTTIHASPDLIWQTEIGLFLHAMSTPLASPSPMSTPIGHTPDFVEAVQRLSAARKMLKSAETARLKVMAIPVKRKGGGAVRKQQAVATYEAALKAYADCQATVASLAESTVQPSSDTVQTAPLPNDSNGTDSEAMEVDNGVKGGADVEIDEGMAVEGGSDLDGENVPDEGSDVEGDAAMGNDVVDESPDLEDGEKVPDEGSDVEGDAGTVSHSPAIINEGTDRYDLQGFEDGTDAPEDPGLDGVDADVVEKGANLGDDAADIVQEGTDVDEHGAELHQGDGEDEVADEGRSDLEDGDYADSEVDEGEEMSVIDLSEDEEYDLKPKIAAKNELDGLIVMDELPDNADSKKTAAKTTLATRTSKSKLKRPVFYKRKKAAKLPVRGDEGIDFETMSTEQREIYDEAAKDAIDAFLRRPHATTIDTRLRRYIRENQSFMPIAATKTRKLALHVLTSNRGNVMCIYHHVVEKTGYLIDGEGDYRLNGVPLPRNVNHVISDGVKRAKGHLHCGCNEDVALLDFYFWKSWSLSGKLPNGSRVTETLKDQMLHPRIRAFVVDQFQSWTGLTIEDIYQGDKRREEHKLDVYHIQVEHILRRMNKVAARVEGEKYFLSVEDLE
ncbi:hypothetical protein H0H92_001828 [Tricholoma furcatifolium]|nr:hypothetical protein H0H92_001828 [Tricholoma furcatifolium]